MPPFLTAMNCSLSTRERPNPDLEDHMLRELGVGQGRGGRGDRYRKRKWQCLLRR